MNNYKKLWWSLAFVFIFSFGVLLYYGGEIYQEMPPIPEEVVTESGEVIMTKSDIQDGQNIWQRMGGQEVGSIWGHGAYVAPDWTADWLHRELVWSLNQWSNEKYQMDFDQLSAAQQGELQARLKEETRTNTYDPKTSQVLITETREGAIEEITNHYAKLFGDDPSYLEEREKMAIPTNAVSDTEDLRKMASFFFWTSWSASTNRMDSDVTYTQNWPHEPLIDNVPTSENILWSIISVVLLIAGVGGLAWYFAVEKGRETHELETFPKKDPLLNIKPTPSMKATLKYFWVVTALILAQVALGVVTAHYAVEGHALYGIPIADIIPYSVTRTWHTQLAIFWIATAWLATGLYIGPAISGKEPKFQRLGVNILFIAVLIVVVGSMIGQWAAVQGHITDLTKNFYFGHQGYEYVDLGRFWQILLTVGLFLWFFLMARAIWPALKIKDGSRHMLILFLIASVAIPVFYIPGLMWDQQTHLSIATYWRWWVVHLWVEGFFEVFATVVIAFLFTRMGLIKTATATASVLFSTIIFLFGGIIGTFHHLYFSGTPTGVLAFGASFSALEVVPLVLIGFEAYENLKHGRATEWTVKYKWIIYFFVAVSFWNLLGAGVFGFLINPPVALYYMQGLNTTPLHGHFALFGVYGMLGIGLMLFCLRSMTGDRIWKTKLLKFSFWALNIGLLAMGLMSLLPVGILQTIASMETGLWYARSTEFLHTDLIQTLVWLRSIGDTIFAIGIVGIAWFVVGLKTGHSFEKEEIKLEEMKKAQ